MEPVLDFGLFEMLAASGLAWVGRFVHGRRALSLMFVALSVVAPAAIVVVAPTELVRWLAAVCLATALVNAAVLLPRRRPATARESSPVS